MEFDYPIDVPVQLAPVPAFYFPAGVDDKPARIVVCFAVLLDANDVYQHREVEFELDAAIELIEDIEREITAHNWDPSQPSPYQLQHLGISVGRDGAALLLHYLAAAFDAHQYVEIDPGFILNPFYEGR